MKIMPTCREASELVSRAQDRPLTVREKLVLYIHLPLCQGCRNFAAQVRFMRRAIQEYVRR